MSPRSRLDWVDRMDAPGFHNRTIESRKKRNSHRDEIEGCVNRNSDPEWEEIVRDERDLESMGRMIAGS